MAPIQDFSYNLWRLLGQDQLQEAIQELQVLLKGSPRFNEVILQSARYSDLMKSIRMDMLEPEQIANEKNKLRYALIDMVRELEERSETDARLHEEVTSLLGTPPGHTQTLTGDGNIGIQGVSDSTIQVHAGNTTNQDADKIYNIDKIDKADFS